MLRRRHFDAALLSVARVVDESELPDADLVAVVLTVTYLGAVLDHIGAGVFLGALSAYGWHKVSGLHGRGYGAALAYWHLGASSFGRTPPSSARHFVR